MIEILRPPVDPENPDGPYKLDTLLALEEGGLLAKGDPKGVLLRHPIGRENIGLKVVELFQAGDQAPTGPDPIAA